MKSLRESSEWVATMHKCSEDWRLSAFHQGTLALLQTCPVTAAFCFRTGTLWAEQLPCKNNVPKPGIKSMPQRWERQILTTRPPGRCAVAALCVTETAGYDGAAQAEIKNYSLSFTNQVFSGSCCSLRPGTTFQNQSDLILESEILLYPHLAFCLLQLCLWKEMKR